METVDLAGSTGNVTPRIMAVNRAADEEGCGTASQGQAVEMGKRQLAPRSWAAGKHGYRRRVGWLPRSEPPMLSQRSCFKTLTFMSVFASKAGRMPKPLYNHVRMHISSNRASPPDIVPFCRLNRALSSGNGTRTKATRF